MAIKPNKYTMSEAAIRAAAKVGKSTLGGKVGQCLAEQINPANSSPWAIPAPWGWGGNGRPWAINYWLNAVAKGKVVKTSNPADVPDGALTFGIQKTEASKAYPAKAGHVWTSDGESGAYTTDQPTSGKWGHVATKAMLDKWGMVQLGYILVTGDGYDLRDPAPSIAPKTEKWTVDVKAGSTLKGRAAPVSGKVLYLRAPGYGITTVGRDTSGQWAVTRYGTWYSVAYLKPRGVPAVTTVTTDDWNVAGYNAEANSETRRKAAGIATWQTRIAKIAASLMADKPDIVTLQELSNKRPVKMLPLLDSFVKGVLTRAPYGTDGRWTLYGSTVKRIASGWRQITPLFEKDSKQLAYICYEKNGIRAIDVSAHLESASGTAADAVRVKQIRNVIALVIAIAKEWNTDLRNVMINLDGNSYNQVREAAEALGWVSAAKVAPTTVNAEYKTHSNWEPAEKGEHFDLSLVLEGVVIESWSQVLDHKNADHNKITVVRQLTAA